MTHETHSIGSHICSARGHAVRAIGFIAIACGSPIAAFAQETTPTPSGEGFVDRVRQGVSAAGTPAGLTNVPPLETVVGGVISTILSFLGVLLLGYILYAGFLWMTAGGEKTKIQNAISMIKNAIIGLLIIVSAYAITEFVLSRLAAVSTGGETV